MKIRKANVRRILLLGLVALPFASLSPAQNVTNAGISLAEALDTEGSFSWSTSETAAWFGQTTVSRDGADAAQSAPVADRGTATVTATVRGPGTVLFWWKVSCETNKDCLRFFINGRRRARISGEKDWQLLSYPLKPGAQTLKWTYSKNPKKAGGQDRAWLDQVQFVPSPQTGGCVVAVSPVGVLHPENAATGSVSVVAAAACDWNVVNTNSWISCSAGAGKGSGIVRYTITRNDSRLPRMGVVLIGGRPFTVTQASGLPPCSYYVSETNVSLRYDQSISSVVTVLTQTGCEWKVLNTNSWISITALATNSGDGHFVYSVSQNTTTVARAGQVFIEGHVLTISQEAAPPFIPPSSPLTEALDTVGSPIVWNQALDPARGYPWVVTTNVTHDGVDAVVISEDFAGASLNATIKGPGLLTFWWKTSGTKVSFQCWVYIFEQAHISGETDWEQRTIAIPPGNNYLWWNLSRGTDASPDRGWLDQVQFLPTLCPLTLSPGTNAHPPGASTGAVDVAAAPDCRWGVFNSNSWITLTSTGSGTGNSTVTYSVASNSTALPRSGRLWIGSQSLVVTQSATQAICTFSLAAESATHGFGVATNGVLLNTLPGCLWSVSNTNPWVKLLSSTTRVGPGLVRYSITVNDSPKPRSGNIQIAGLNFLLTQDGNPNSPSNGIALPTPGLVR